ncbi:putative RNA-binding protein [Trypanosoma cruzi]|uniref:Putative RNA-binding protein n=1 Tax=Trypanosoma cruzi TaxID=5693 RepID=A0A2V2X2L3_TRYCR|nr:putative RNA-binding protein [Trypanosoma cruzi]
MLSPRLSFRRSNGSSLENIKKRLAEKRRAVQGGASEGQTANEHTTSAASLKERLAMKKAQLSSVAKPSSVTETETAAVAVPSAQTLTSHKDTAPTPVHLFFGFPIPSRFPTKTDYLTHSKSPSFRAGLMFRYVPPAVAERILPPSARPPPA